MQNQYRNFPSLINQSVIVTGGARGIGGAIARAFAEEGADVFIFDTDTSGNKINHYEAENLGGYQAALKLAEELTQQDFKVQALEVDATSEDQVKAAFAKVALAGKPLFGVVNAIGSSHVCDTRETSLQAFNAIVETNLTAPFIVSREAAQVLSHQGKGGAILNISSIAAKVAFPGISAYCAAKAGLQGFSSALALELSEENIRVNCVAPGIVKTNMWKYLENQLIEPQENLETFWQRMTGLIPSGRTQEPENIAKFCLSIMTNEDITAQNLSIDGGMNLYG